MTGNDSVFAGSIPEIYDRLMVPMLFEPYAGDLAERVARHEPREVLELAAGTGVVTRALVAKLPGARIVATDLNQPMLSRGAAALAGNASVTLRQADALKLPFDPASFDAVVCQFGVMFFPDKLAGYREARRVLRTGGHFLFNVWDRLAENEFADTVQQALALVFPGDPPRFMERTPHGYYDLGEIQDQLKLAGFSAVSFKTRGHIGRGASPEDVAVAYCQGTPLRGEIEARDPTRLAEATERATAALTLRFGGGPLEGRIRAHVIDAAA